MTDTIPAGAEALIFDLDGTLVDSTQAHYAAWYQTLAEIGVDLDMADFQELFGKTTGEMLAELESRTGRRLPAEQLAGKKDAYFSRAVTMIPANRPVVEVVEQYAGSLPLAVATNENMGIANMVLRATGLQPRFDVLVAGNEVSRPKPAPDLFIECARRLGLAPERCHVFEDSSYGVEAAVEAGMSVTDVRRYL